MRHRRAWLILLVALWGCRGDEAPALSTIAPNEVADADALGQLSDWGGLPVFGAGTYRMQSSEDRKTGWEPPIALWSHDNRDFNNFVCRGADVDAVSPQVPYVFDLEACPESYVRGMVMARFEGRGRLARLWMTAASIRDKAPDDEVVRIYVDDREAPLIQVPLAEMLAGGGHEIFAPPFGAGSRRYVAWHYPVVFDGKIIVSIDGLGQNDLYFHQTSVVLDERDERRAAPAHRLGQRGQAKRFLAGGVPASGRTVSQTLDLAAGTTRDVVFSGPATIVSTEVTGRLNDLVVRVYWDGETSPSIDVPLAALVGSFDTPTTRPSLALSANSLRLPMPFAEAARWEIHNASATPTSLTITHQIARGVPSARWGHLHAQHHATSGQAAGVYHPLAKATGRGRLVGTCIAMRGHGLRERGGPGHPFHFLEGDELGVIDGERVLAGTGTEDYFDGAFYFEEGAIGTPFAQVWDITPRITDSPTQGRVSTCRWHVLGDTIDFRKSLDLSLEIGPGVAEVLDDYRSIVFLYQ